MLVSQTERSEVCCSARKIFEVFVALVAHSQACQYYLCATVLVACQSTFIVRDGRLSDLLTLTTV